MREPLQMGLSLLTESLILLVASPMIAGLALSFLIAVLQIQDATFPALAKMVLGGLCCWMFGGLLLQQLVEFFHRTLEMIAVEARG